MLTAKKFVIPVLAALPALGGFSLTAAAHDEAKAVKTAAKAEEKPGEAEKKKRRGCAFRRSIHGFSVIDDEHFVLDANGDFLVTLSPGCHNLDFEMAIAIKSTPGAGLCVERGDRVILDDHFTCWIQDIERVENKEEAKKLVEEREKAEEEEKEGEEG